MSEFLSCLRLNNTILCIYYILFIRSSVSVHLGCFHRLAVVINSVIKMDVQMPESLLWIVLVIYPEVEQLDYIGILFLISWEIAIVFASVTAPFDTLSNNAQGFQFLIVLPTLVIFWVLFVWFLFAWFLIIGTLSGVKWYLMVIFIYIPLIFPDVEHLFICLLPICISLNKCLLMSFT